MTGQTVLMLLKGFELVVMIGAVGIAHYRANSINRNKHFTNGRPKAAIIIAFLWALWTFLVSQLDYEYLYGYNTSNVINDSRIVRYIIIELINIIATFMTAAHLLGYEFKWLKNN